MHREEDPLIEWAAAPHGSGPPLRARTYQQVCKHVGGTRWERRGAISTCGKRTECMHEMFFVRPDPICARKEKRRGHGVGGTGIM